MGAYHYSPDILPLLLSAAMLLALAAYAWRHRSVAGATPFAIVELLVAAANLANILEISANDFSQIVTWRSAWFLYLALVPLAYVAFALEYSGLARRMTRRAWAILAAPSVFFALLLLTNGWHHWIWERVWFDGALQVERGLAGWATIAYAYGLGLANLVILIGVLIRARGLYRAQAGVVALAGLSGWIGMGLRLAGVDLLPQIEAFALSLIITSPLMAFAIFKFRAFDLVPIARDMVIENMGDGLIVLDTHNRVVDLNPAAQKLLGIGSKVIGEEAALALGGWEDLKRLALEAGTAEVAFAVQATGRWQSARAWPLIDSGGEALGRVIMLRDATALHAAQGQLLEHERALAGLAERERLARELHDDLGQTIGFVSTQAQAIRRLISKGDAVLAGQFTTRLIEVAQEADADIRDSILGLRSLSSLEQGLGPALEGYLKRFSHQYGIQVDCVAEGDLDDSALSFPVKVQLLRIVQEALANVRKHAGARCVHVTVKADQGWAQVRIDDDGQGFDPAEVLASNNPRFGLRFMQERAQAVGGMLEIDSAHGRATHITVRVPLTRSVHESASG